MPVAPTYPGVYIEEVPSGVHTITGVSTSTAAFVGYTARGPVDKAVHIFSFGDFERAFSGLSADSPVSYSVRQFFQNGGSEAYVVRVANNARTASVTMKNASAANVLIATAATPGTWGNRLQIDVDYDTLAPAWQFNLRVTEFVEKEGQLVPDRVEMFRNLTQNSAAPNYALTVVNAKSELVSLSRPAGLAFNAASTSTTGAFASVPSATPPAGGYRFAFTLNGGGPYEVGVPVPGMPAAVGATLTDALTLIKNDVVQAITQLFPGAVTGAVVGSQVVFTAVATATVPAEKTSLHFYDASTKNITVTFKMGVLRGGTELEAAGAARPLPTGTTGNASIPSAANPGALTINVFKGTGAAALKIISLPLWNPPATVPAPTTPDEVVLAINNALGAAAPAESLLAGAFAQRMGNLIRLVPGPADPDVYFTVSGATATALALDAASAANVARYAPGRGSTVLAQVAGTTGDDGSIPTANQLLGTESAKDGMYALEDVDLFNLLVIPEASAGAGLPGVLSEAIAYCTKRRAFMIIDVPDNVSTFAKAQTWLGTSDASALRSRNSGIFFPRLRAPDPLKDNIVDNFPAAGALAGLFARTDGDRGVWKAPAGTLSTLIGATGLSYTLNDRENGALNPLALNCLRTFPVVGTVNWGARTGKGADVLADEYKYIPVRRLALYLEESLYRGTQWVVFEPNDEPLWAQIRLNIGAFMHTLYAKGAFQGRTPRDAYFVKCDAETTTQNDIDLGRVNIVVGFAPLKPAEFVIVRIQQIAGAILT